jgi:hypothetical protein
MKAKAPLNAEQTRAWVSKSNRTATRTMWGFYILAHPVVLVIAWVATGGLSRDLLMTVAFVSVVTLVLLLYSRAKLRQSWYGKVVRKEIVKRSVNRNEDAPNKIKLMYQVVIQTGAGKEKKVPCLPSLYQYVNEGDEILKVSGFSGYEKGHVDGQIRCCIGCGTVFAVSEGRCPRCKAPLPDHPTLVNLAKS